MQELMDEKKPTPKPQKSPAPVDEPALELTHEHDRDLLASQVESSRLYE